MSEASRIVRVHQIALSSPPQKVSGFSDLTKRKAKDSEHLYQKATYRLWTREELRDMIAKEFDADVARTFDKLSTLSRKRDLARCCLLYTFGGLCFDGSIRLTNTWTIPEHCGIAAFCIQPTLASTWTNMHPGLLWSEPKRAEWSIAIKRMVEHCRARWSGLRESLPTGEVLLGRAFATVMARRKHNVDADDQWIGEIRDVAGRHGLRDLAFVAPDRVLVGVQMSGQFQKSLEVGRRVRFGFEY
jgi:hypothetical protein